jgi:hypothetical protein
MYHWFEGSRSAILILSFGIALLILIPGQTREPEELLPFQDTSPSISAGSRAYLSAGGTSIGVGANLETFTALAEALVAKDRKAYERLFKNGGAFLVDDRVQVLVINIQANTAQVQLLEGYHSHKLAFVLREWLKSER